MNVKTNEGPLDRVVRIVVGIATLSVLLTVGPVPGWGLAGLVGLLPLVTGLVGYCPAYTVAGIVWSRLRDGRLFGSAPASATGR